MPGPGGFFAAAVDLHRRSNGLFDIAVAPLFASGSVCFPIPDAPAAGGERSPNSRCRRVCGPEHRVRFRPPRPNGSISAAIAKGVRRSIGAGRALRNAGLTGVWSMRAAISRIRGPAGPRGSHSRTRADPAPDDGPRSRSSTKPLRDERRPLRSIRASRECQSIRAVVDPRTRENRARGRAGVTGGRPPVWSRMRWTKVRS